MSHTLSISKNNTTTPLALYEGNYRRILRLFPELHDLNKGTFVEVYEAVLSITIIDQHKYTTLITLEYRLGTDHRFSDIVMELRVCHDAALLEVIAYQGQNPIHSIHAYPNKHMLQADEKKQINLFLRDILEHALKLKSICPLSTMP